MKPQILRIQITAVLSALIFYACTSPVVPPTAAVSLTNTSKDQSPAPATLNLEGATQTARIGSYCWSYETSPGEQVEACMDSVGIPTDPIPLPAKEHLTASLSLPYEESPTQLSLSVFEASEKIQTGNSEYIRLYRK